MRIQKRRRKQLLEEQLTQYVHLMHGSASAGAGKSTDGTCVRVEEDAGVGNQDDRAHLLVIKEIADAANVFV